MERHKVLVASTAAAFSLAVVRGGFFFDWLVTANGPAMSAIRLLLRDAQRDPRHSRCATSLGGGPRPESAR